MSNKVATGRKSEGERIGRKTQEKYNQRREIKKNRQGKVQCQMHNNKQLTPTALSAVCISLPIPYVPVMNRQWGQNFYFVRRHVYKKNAWLVLNERLGWIMQENSRRGAGGGVWCRRMKRQRSVFSICKANDCWECVNASKLQDWQARGNETQPVVIVIFGVTSDVP